MTDDIQSNHGGEGGRTANIANVVTVFSPLGNRPIRHLYRFTGHQRAHVRSRYNYRPDSDLYIIDNVGTQFASIAPANPPRVCETPFAIKWTCS